MGWIKRLRNVFRSDRVSDEIGREMSFHLAERTDDLIGTGMTSEAARREARRRFGNYLLQRERTRDRDLMIWLESALGDVRYALRNLRAAPGFTAVAILSLALGIGGTTAIFSVINATMLRSLPFNRADELMVLTRSAVGDVKGTWNFPPPLWEEVRRNQAVFAAVFAYGSRRVDLSTGGESRRVPAGFVSGSFFAALDARTIRGRSLAEVDDRPGCPPVAVISYGFWQREYGGRDGVIGASVPLDGHPFQIVGVADPRFFGLEIGYDVPIWVPLCAESIVRGPATLGRRGGMARTIVGRMTAGATPAQTRARFAAIAPALMRAAGLPPETALELVPFSRGIPALRVDYGAALFLLLAAVAVVLAVACANVANLLLARAISRHREIAVRLAIGASRGRLFRQLLTESLLLSFLGASAGVFVAAWGSRVLVGLMSSPGQAVLVDISLDAPVLAFTIGMATITGLLFGLVPAWRTVHGDAREIVSPSGRGIASGHSRFGLGKALVVGQIALALVSITAAGLLLGSWIRLNTLDPGFRRDRVLLMGTDIRPERIPDGLQATLYGRLLNRLRTMPGVVSASASQRTPIGNSSWNAAIEIEGRAATPDDAPVVRLNEVSDGYFATLGIPVLEGRDFNSTDLAGSGRVAIVSRELARTFFAGTSAIGQRIRLRMSGLGATPVEIIGIAADTKLGSLREPDQPIVYLALAQDAELGPFLNFEIHTRNSPAALVPAIKFALAGVTPRTLVDFVTLDDQLSQSLRIARSVGLLSGFFGALALLLAAVGLYGIMSYTVARRRNEIGVRIALGARRSRVMRMVFEDAARMMAIGLVAGLSLSWLVTRFATSFLYGVTPHDPVTLALAGVLLTAVGIGAAGLPAARAARLNPVTALRDE